jgi:hypothetical protein
LIYLKEKKSTPIFRVLDLLFWDPRGTIGLILSYKIKFWPHLPLNLPDVVYCKYVCFNEIHTWVQIGVPPDPKQILSL